LFIFIYESLIVLVLDCGACALRSLPYNANPMPMAQSITTVKNQRHTVSFLAKIKQETDKMSVSCYQSDLLAE
jgi:hypothetical protein